MEPSQRENAATPEPPLDPVDVAWLQRRPSSGALILGVLSLLTAPLLLGLIFAPLGLRAALDSRRRGIGGPVVAGGLVLSGAGLLASISAALLWGALLSGVLLGRDAILATEGLRGQSVQPIAVQAKTRGGSRPLLLAPRTGEEQPLDPDRPRQPFAPRGEAPAPRIMVLVVRLGTEPSASALVELATASQRHPEVPIIFVDQERSADEIETAARSAGAAIADRDWFLGADAALPPPLDAIAATPTFIVVAADGRIERALVGVYPASELEKLLRGDARLPHDEGAAAGGQATAPGVR